MEPLNASFERKIVTGLIVSTEYITEIRRFWNIKLVQSSMAKRLCLWCIEYFDTYNKAPFKDIEGIFLEKLKTGKVPKDVAEEIEEEILPGLSDEYEREGKFNSEYLLAQTKRYFKERQLRLHTEQIQNLIDQGEITEAENKALSFQVEQTEKIKVGLDLGTEEALYAVDKAFNQELQRVITYPGPLGEMWNDQLVRGGFIGLLGPEKRGKTFRLMDMSIRAMNKKANVAFFQAGDMTEAQQLKRICVYLARKSDRERYCGKLFLPVKDCLWNQLDTCESADRECDFGLFRVKEELQAGFRDSITFDMLKTAWEENQAEYKPCWNCKKNYKGSVWIKEIETGDPLTSKEAKEHLFSFFGKYKNRFKLSTHVNGTLTIQEMNTILQTWEKQDGFVPDVIVLDYADLLTTSKTQEFRHQQDYIWRSLRAMSQEKHCLVITATQADAKSYETNRLKLSNFSEDKRKYAHVTAMYGLNQDKLGREKKLGLLRINELVVREGDFDSKEEVYILQNLQTGRPFLGSFK